MRTVEALLPKDMSRPRGCFGCPLTRLAVGVDPETCRLLTRRAVGEDTEIFRLVACESLRALLDRTFGVRIVEGSLVGVLSPDIEKSPSGADLKLIFSNAVAAPSSDASPEGILSSLGRLRVLRA